MWDHEIDELMRQFSEANLAIGLSVQLQFRALKHNFNRNIKLIPDLLPEVQVKLFHEMGLGSKFDTRIKEILDPSPEFQMLVVDVTPLNIFNLNKQTEEVQLLALNKNSELVFQGFKNPSYKVQKLGVDKFPDNIRYIKNPSYELMLDAVSKKPRSIIHIINPPPDLIDLAINNPENADLIEYIKNATSEQQIKCIKNNYFVYSKIKNPTPEADWVACSLRSSNFTFVKNQTIDLAIMTLEKDLEEVISKFKELGRDLTIADKEVQEKLQAYKSVKLVKGSSHEEVLDLLKKRKIVSNELK